MHETEGSPSVRDHPSTTVGLHKSIIRRHHVGSTESLATIDIPPCDTNEIPPSKVYRPLSLHVLALLMPASIFGVLARLGLEALVAYNGQSVFSMAYIQAAGCFVMGIALGIKAPLGRLYASPLLLGHIALIDFCSYGPLYTALTTGELAPMLLIAGGSSIYDVAQGSVDL